MNLIQNLNNIYPYIFTNYYYKLLEFHTLSAMAKFICLNSLDFVYKFII